MKQDSMPLSHPDPWVNVLRGYITEAVEAVDEHGLVVERSWLDPRDPRDATIIFSHPAAARELGLVWDEVTGWRCGIFESGAQGVRTVLSDTRYLGGALLLSGQDVAGRVLAGATEPRREHRSVADLHDGLDDSLLARN